MAEQNAFIIHGAYGNPRENWFPWLAAELEAAGIATIVPAFPTPDGQSLENWRDVFQEYESRINDHTVFIGHSLGPAFILDVLERIDVTVRAAVFVSGFTGSLGIDKFDRLNTSFTERDFDWDRITAHCDTFRLYHGDNDPYVPVSKAEKLRERLDAELTVVPNAGHFNEDAGYTEFSRLRDDVLNVFQ